MVLPKVLVLFFEDLYAASSLWPFHSTGPLRDTIHLNFVQRFVFYTISSLDPLFKLLTYILTLGFFSVGGGENDKTRTPAAVGGVTLKAKGDLLSKCNRTFNFTTFAAFPLPLQNDCRKSPQKHRWLDVTHNFFQRRSNCESNAIFK